MRDERDLRGPVEKRFYNRPRDTYDTTVEFLRREVAYLLRSWDGQIVFDLKHRARLYAQLDECKRKLDDALKQLGDERNA